jgi:hypothetical protein
MIPLLRLASVVLVVAALGGCNSRGNQASPVVFLEITAGHLHARIEGANASYVNSGGPIGGGKDKVEFNLGGSRQDEGKIIQFGGELLYSRDLLAVPEEERGNFQITGDWDSKVAAVVQVKCSVPVKILVDGKEVSAPAEITAGKHQLIITGRFKPKS